MGKMHLHHHIEIVEENSQHVHKPATSPSSLHIYPDCSSSHDNIMASSATVSTLGFVPPTPPPPQPLSRSLSRMRHSRLEQPRATSGGGKRERGEGTKGGGRPTYARRPPAPQPMTSEKNARPCARPHSWCAGQDEAARAAQPRMYVSVSVFHWVSCEIRSSFCTTPRNGKVRLDARALVAWKRRRRPCDRRKTSIGYMQLQVPGTSKLGSSSLLTAFKKEPTGLGAGC